jgi:hypothetical protein
MDPHQDGTCDCLEIDGVKSLWPTMPGQLPSPDTCNWELHEAAVEEAGFCPVCQH